MLFIGSVYWRWPNNLTDTDEERDAMKEEYDKFMKDHKIKHEGKSAAEMEALGMSVVPDLEEKDLKKYVELLQKLDSKMKSKITNTNSGPDYVFKNEKHFPNTNNVLDKTLVDYGKARVTPPEYIHYNYDPLKLPGDNNYHANYHLLAYAGSLGHSSNIVWKHAPVVHGLAGRGATDWGPNSIHNNWKHGVEDGQKAIDAFFKTKPEGKLNLKLTGHSRGAVAASFVAVDLHNANLSLVSSKKLVIDLVMFDPVPGPLWMANPDERNKNDER